MDPLTLGILFGVALAAFDVATMARLRWPSHAQKLDALAGAAIERFMLGLLIPTVDLGTPRWLVGVILGVGLSLPSALLTRAYQPIIGVGLVAGLLLGIVAQVAL